MSLNHFPLKLPPEITFYFIFIVLTLILKPLAYLCTFFCLSSVTSYMEIIHGETTEACEIICSGK